MNALVPVIPVPIFAAAKEAAERAADEAIQAAQAAEKAKLAAQHNLHQSVGPTGHDHDHIGPLLAVAGVFTLLAVCASAITLVGHLQNFTMPEHQIFICRIILLAPIYAIISFLALAAPTYAVALETLRGCYEAFVLYAFFALLLTYLGGERALGEWLETRGYVQHWGIIRQLFPKRRNIALGHSFLRRVQQGILQFVFVKPMTALLALLLSLAGVYHEGHFRITDAYLYLSLINNCSVSLALYCLVLFYLATESILQPFKPISKFLAVKAVIFFCYWQYCGLQTLYLVSIIPSQPVVSMTQNSLICIEMFIAAIVFHIAFTPSDYARGSNGRTLASRLVFQSEIFRMTRSSIATTTAKTAGGSIASHYDDPLFDSSDDGAEGASRSRGSNAIANDMDTDGIDSDEETSSLLPKFITVIDGRDVIQEGKNKFIDKDHPELRMELADHASAFEAV